MKSTNNSDSPQIFNRKELNPKSDKAPKRPLEDSDPELDEALEESLDVFEEMLLEHPKSRSNEASKGNRGANTEINEPVRNASIDDNKYNGNYYEPTNKKLQELAKKGRDLDTRTNKSNPREYRLFPEVFNEFVEEMEARGTTPNKGSCSKFTSPAIRKTALNEGNEVHQDSRSKDDESEKIALLKLFELAVIRELKTGPSYLHAPIARGGNETVTQKAAPHERTEIHQDNAKFKSPPIGEANKSASEAAPQKSLAQKEDQLPKSLIIPSLVTQSQKKGGVGGENQK